MTIDEKIAIARKNKNLTQEQLAELMSVTRQSISRWESDQSYPEMDKISYLAELLGVSCDYLLRNDMMTEEKQPSSNAITRLLYGAKGKIVQFQFYDDMIDYELISQSCKILDFDGSWLEVEYQKKKKDPAKKLIPVSSIISIQFMKEEGH